MFPPGIPHFWRLHGAAYPLNKLLIGNQSLLFFALLFFVLICFDLVSNNKNKCSSSAEISGMNTGFGLSFFGVGQLTL
tara:strand:+ start:216 stop:449 length:234 start_codon:yes stop_codon:yes gene_type:complete